MKSRISKRAILGENGNDSDKFNTTLSRNRNSGQNIHVLGNPYNQEADE